MKSIALFLFCATSLVTFSARAKESCDKALDSIPKFESSKKMFHEIHQFKSRYSHCMDGGIAEAVAAVIVESLDKNWSQLGDIKELSKKDSLFKKFILSNIEPNVTGQEAEVTSIIAKAKTSCPRQMKPFCRELRKSSERSLRPD